MKRPTLGDYLAKMDVVLDQIRPSDDPTLVGFNDMCPVTGQIGSDLVTAWVTHDSNGEQMVEFNLPVTHHR